MYIADVRDYLEHRIEQIDPVYQRARGESGEERGPDWPAIWAQRAWLHWLECKALSRAERAGIGAVMGVERDDTLLETLGLLDEQLHEQQTEWTDASGRRRGGGQVSRDLTQNAVEPFWTSPTAISASAEGWRRRSESIERRLWRLNRDLGGATPIQGYEAAHRYAEAAACEYAAYRQLQVWGSGAAAAEADERLAQVRQALEQALAAYQSSDAPRDRIGEEIASIARLIRR